MRITVIGVGYVGLVTGACLAKLGHTVSCLDIDPDKIAMLKKGEIPIYEPGLKELVQNGNITFTTSYEEAIPNAEICFLAVGTPPNDDGSVDLTALFSAAESVNDHMSENLLIATKSTVPVGTAKKLKYLLTKTTCSIVSNPEFLKEGSAVTDCLNPDRIIVGYESPRAKKTMLRLYRDNEIIFMDIESAELTKYAANAMLATRISFMNELSQLCDKVGADIRAIQKGIGSDSRIGHQFLHAGAGYGGSCFPKDVQGLIHTLKENGVTPHVLEGTDKANKRQRSYLAEKIFAHFNGHLIGKKIAIWGLTFKPGTDDMRESPALELIEQLEGAELSLFDPIANYPNLAPSEYEAATGADAVVLVTEWEQFKNVDLNRIKALMKGDSFFDGRNQFDPVEMAQKGFTYYAIGVPSCELAKTMS